MPMTSGRTKPIITIRELTSFDDFVQVEAAEKEIWTLDDIGVLPVTMSIAAKEAGCIWLGAFDKESFAGFAFGILGLENGELNIHSHMLGVLPAYRDLDIGYKLKLAQREHAMALRVKDGRGGEIRIREMTWTFDPLHARNAHLNFAKLGVVCDRYKPDFYGPATTSVLHQNSTDRLWVRWLIDSRRVRERLEAAPQSKTKDVVPSLVRYADGKPIRCDLAGFINEPRLLIEIPDDILAIENKDTSIAREWRTATRWTFTEALGAGFFVAEFYGRNKQGVGTYLLEKGSIEDYVPEMGRKR
jgi:predicted GNAT superfamily acetyltransferase